MHLNDNTYILMINVIAEAVGIAREKEAILGPFPQEQDFALRKAMEVRQMAITEAKTAGVLPHSYPEPRA